MNESPRIDNDVNPNRKSRRTGNQFHPMNPGFTDNEQVSDLESAKYLAEGVRVGNDIDSDHPPAFIDAETLQNQNNFRSAKEKNVSPGQTIDGKFRLGGMMESDIEESGNNHPKIALDQSFSTEKSAKGIIQEREVRQRPRTAYNKNIIQSRTSPQSRVGAKIPSKRSHPKPGFLQNQNSVSGYQINQQIRNKKKETYNKILEKAYFGSGNSKTYNQFTNRSRKLVASKTVKSHLSDKKIKKVGNFRNLNGDDTDSLNLKQTMGEHLSDNSFNVPKPANKRSRVQSAYVRKDNIEEIEEEGFDSVNIKTMGHNFTDNEHEQSTKLINFYRQKFANKEKASRSLKAISQHELKEDLADQLYSTKVKLNSSIEEKKALATQNKTLKREIQANETVIQMMLKNQAPSQASQGVNHYSLMIQHKRKLRETLQENNSLKISLDQMRKDMRNTKEAELKQENQQLLIQTQTMQFNVKRLQDYILELKDNLQTHVKRDIASSDNLEQFELKQQIKDYKQITKKQEITITNLEKINQQHLEDIQSFQVKIESIRHKFDNKEVKLQFKLSQQEAEMSALSQLKRQVDNQKNELKQNRLVIESYKPKMEALSNSKVAITKERDFLNNELVNSMKQFKVQLKEKNKEFSFLNEEIENKMKAQTSKHNKELNQLNNKLNKSLGQNRNLDEILVQKQTDFSAENKLKMQVKKLEIELESLRLVQKKTRGTTPKKKKKMNSADYDSDNYESAKLQADQKILEKDYAIEKLMTKVGQLENKNKELLSKSNKQDQCNNIQIQERNESEENDAHTKSDKKIDQINQSSAKEHEMMNVQQEISKNTLNQKELELQQSKENHEQLIKETQETLEQFNKQHKEIQDGLESQIDQKNKEIEYLTHNIEQIQDSLVDRNQDYEAIKEKYESGEMDRDNLEMEIQNHLNTIKDKESALDEVIANHMELKNQLHQEKGEKEEQHDNQTSIIVEQQQKIEQMNGNMKQINDLQIHIESLENEIIEQKKSLDQIREENDQIKLQIHVHSEQTRNNNEEIKKHQKQNYDDQFLTEKLKVQIEDQNTNQNFLTEQILELQSAIAYKKLIQNAGDQDEKYLILELQLKETENKNEGVKADYQEMIIQKDKEIKESEDHIKTLQEDTQQINEDKEQEIKILQDEIHVGLERNQFLEREMEDRDNEIQAIQGSNENKKSSGQEGDRQNNLESESFKLQYLEVKNHLEQAIYEKDQLQSQIDNFNQHQNEATAQDEACKELTAKLAKIEAENQDLKDKFEQMDINDRDENGETFAISTNVLSKQKSTTSNESSQINSNNNILTAEVERYKKKIAEAMDQTFQLKRNDNDQVAEIKEMKNQIKDKQNDIDRLKQDIQNEQSDLQDLKQEHNELKLDYRNKELELKKLQSELDKAVESKNQLFDKLLAEKDAKTALIQQFAQAQEQGLSVWTGPGSQPEDSKKKENKKLRKEIEVEISMEKVEEEPSYEKEESEEEEIPQQSPAQNSKKDGHDSDSGEEHVEEIQSSADAKSVISIDVVSDANPPDHDDYEVMYLQVNKQLNDYNSINTIDEASQSMKSGKSLNESAQGLFEEENPPDPMK